MRLRIYWDPEVSTIRTVNVVVAKVTALEIVSHDHEVWIPRPKRRSVVPDGMPTEWMMRMMMAALISSDGTSVLEILRSSWCLNGESTNEPGPRQEHVQIALNTPRRARRLILVLTTKTTEDDITSKLCEQDYALLQLSFPNRDSLNPDKDIARETTLCPLYNTTLCLTSECRCTMSKGPMRGYAVLVVAQFPTPQQPSALQFLVQKPHSVNRRSRIPHGFFFLHLLINYSYYITVDL
jgi:hypothetical protein